MNDVVAALKREFLSFFAKNCEVYRAPGRINLIGEHTEFSEGLVLPAAIDASAYVAISASTSGICTVVASDFNAKVSFDIKGDLKPVPEGGWENYILGLTHYLKKRGVKIEAFEMLVSSEVPIGVGMSSSAALTCAMAAALNGFFKLGIRKFELAKIAQAAENDFVGVSGGMADQYVSCMGKTGHVLQLDCRTFQHDYYPFDLGNHSLVVFDARLEPPVKIKDLEQRKSLCFEGLKVLRSKNKYINTLRDVTLLDLLKIKDLISQSAFTCCQYVIEENMRVVQACEALLDKDIAYLGQLMIGSHRGLSELYRVSSQELDLLVTLAENHSNVVGAKMMGSGLGSCTINLIKTDNLESTVTEIALQFKDKTDLDLRTYTTSIGDGARWIETALPELV